MQATTQEVRTDVAIDVPVRENRNWLSWLIPSVLVAVGTMVSALRLFGLDRDYWQYVEYFEVVRSGGCETAFELRFEPGFAFLTCSIASLDPTGAVVTNAV